MDEISFRTATLTDNSESCPNMVNHLFIIKRIILFQIITIRWQLTC